MIFLCRIFGVDYNGYLRVVKVKVIDKLTGLVIIQFCVVFFKCVAYTWFFNQSVCVYHLHEFAHGKERLEQKQSICSHRAPLSILQTLSGWIQRRGPRCVGIIGTYTFYEFFVSIIKFNILKCRNELFCGIFSYMYCTFGTSIPMVQKSYVDNLAPMIAVHFCF